MNISAVIARTTRSLHELSVSLHLSALRLTVAKANAVARVEHRGAMICSAARVEAERMERRAHELADGAAQNAVNVKTAAASEAINIGGVL